MIFRINRAHSRRTWRYSLNKWRFMNLLYCNMWLTYTWVLGYYVNCRYKHELFILKYSEIHTEILQKSRCSTCVSCDIVNNIKVLTKWNYYLKYWRSITPWSTSRLLFHLYWHLETTEQFILFGRANEAALRAVKVTGNKVISSKNNTNLLQVLCLKINK